VVTGGSRGVGAAACRLLAASGARVAAVARTEGPLQDLVDELRWTGSDAIGVVADCADPDSVAELRDCVEAELGPATVVLAFAGGDPVPATVLDLDPGAWERAVRADLVATFLTVRAFLPAMLAAGGGAIVTMGAADEPDRTNAAFAAAKAGIAAFTRQVAAEIQNSGVRVNCLVRGFDSAPPADVAFAALYLASTAASCINATTLAIAGGKLRL
jgi:3-oxoacyl-[acyl-carrier protein] reductase